jgi:hypothetical protein
MCYIFQEHWIGHVSPVLPVLINWPLQTPDLSLCDFPFGLAKGDCSTVAYKLLKTFTKQWDLTFKHANQQIMVQNYSLSWEWWGTLKVCIKCCTVCNKIYWSSVGINSYTSVTRSGGGGQYWHLWPHCMMSLQSLTNITTTLQIFARVSHSELGE